MRPEEIITYGSRVQEAMGEYRNIVNSQQWEPTDIKENYQDDHLPLSFSAEEIEEPVINTVNKADFKNSHSGKDNDYGEGTLPIYFQLVTSVAKSSV